MPLSKETLLLYVLVYIQQFDAENISVENAIFVVAFRTIFEKNGGSIAPSSPVAARRLELWVSIKKIFAELCIPFYYTFWH